MSRAPLARPHRLSLANIAEAAMRVARPFRNSPAFECEPLAELLACRLILKLETANPIRSFKGRGADYLIQRRVEREQRGALVCASAGNFGQALAYACRDYCIPVAVCASVRSAPSKLARIQALGAEIHVAGEDLDAAKGHARELARVRSSTFVEDGLEPEISEGAGSIAVELLASYSDLDAIFVSLGNGALASGVGRWTKAVSPTTRVVAVASAGAPAMAESFRTGGLVTHARVDTIADGIAIRVPVPAALDDMHTTVDDVVVVDDATIIAAMRLLYLEAGLVVEPAGAAGLAGVIAAGRTLEGCSVATVLGGSNIAPEELARLIQMAP